MYHVSLKRRQTNDCSKPRSNFVKKNRSNDVNPEKDGRSNTECKRALYHKCYGTTMNHSANANEEFHLLGY